LAIRSFAIAANAYRWLITKNHESRKELVKNMQLRIINFCHKFMI